MEILSVSKAKIIDKKTIEEVGVPSIVLMENAGSEIAKSISEKGVLPIPPRTAPTTAIIKYLDKYNFLTEESRKPIAFMIPISFVRS